jgi:hypothetical protein
MSKKSNIEYSKFWLGDNFDIDKEFGKGDTIDLIRLSGFRRAVSNFVFILTNKNVPVRFAEKSGKSMTDGKVIYIGGDLSKGEFDATVGLSLHEAMHIVKSDFSIIKNMWGRVPKSIQDETKGKLANNTVADFVKYVLNVVEDRYIDAWAYEAAPGYRGYYVALYNRYFNLPEVDEGLKSDAYRTPTLFSYKFRFTNFTNVNSDLTALPGLQEISDVLDMENILRLSHPEDRVDIAIKIVGIIVKHIVKADEEKNNKKSDDTKSSDGGEQGEGEGEEQEGGKGEEQGDEKKESSSDDIDDILGGENSKADRFSDEDKQKELAGEGVRDSGDLSDKQMEKLEKIIEKQIDVVNREIKQKEFSEEIINKLNLLEKSGIEMEQVGGTQGVPLVSCIVVKNMTKELMESPEFPYTCKMSSFRNYKMSEDGVQRGVVLGTILGKKLQVRGESRSTRFTRLEKGKFDQRLISELGFGCEKVFYQIQTDSYKNAHLHVSVDASSSMTNKWEKTMTAVVAMAKAASMVPNLGITISFRSGAVLSKRDMFSYNEIPYVVIAYDSRKDKFSKVTQLFPMLSPQGSTPEGLAFEAILDIIPASSPDLDSYFVNLSDGEPMFSKEYFGQIAWTHTQRQVNKIRSSGVEVLSYFVGENGSSDDRTNGNMAAFRGMYGKDAQLIDIGNVSEIALTMNKKFLLKDK